MAYQVKVSAQAKKNLRKVDAKFEKKILDRIDLLQNDPRPNGCLKMSGFENTYRIRIGKYRIVYEIYDKKVYILVVNVDQRKDIYR